MSLNTGCVDNTPSIDEANSIIKGQYHEYLNCYDCTQDQRIKDLVDQLFAVN